MTAFAEPITLEGRHAVLEPLAYTHEAELSAAVRDGELWQLWYTAIPRPEGMRAEIERRLGLQQAGSMLPFAVRSLASGKIAGMTTYMNIDANNRRVEIGSTWYAKSVQRTPLNTECKLMLLAHAFEKTVGLGVQASGIQGEDTKGQAALAGHVDQDDIFSTTERQGRTRKVSQCRFEDVLRTLPAQLGGMMIEVKGGAHRRLRDRELHSSVSLGG